jgi:small-conductance mechanosensitive channel
MATFQEQMMGTILPRLIDGMNKLSARIQTVEEDSPADKTNTALVSQHDIAIAQIKQVLRNQLERIEVLDEIKVQLYDALDRINSLEAKLADKPRKRRARKAEAVDPAPAEADVAVVEAEEVLQ